MLRSLVGSEMCIRDSILPGLHLMVCHQKIVLQEKEGLDPSKEIGVGDRDLWTRADQPGLHPIPAYQEEAGDEKSGPTGATASTRPIRGQNY